MRSDLRYALRSLLRNPGFALLALFILALGIGANSAIFSVVNGVLLRPLPYPHSDRLIWGWGSFQLGNDAGISAPDFVAYRSDSRSFEQLAAFSIESDRQNLAGGAEPIQVATAVVSGNFFAALGVRPVLGRTFTLANEQFSLPQVAILSEHLWRQHFSADPAIIGKTIPLDNRPLTVVGVAPAAFNFPAKTDVWLPIPLLNAGAQSRTGHWLRVVGLLKAGVSLAAAQAEINTIAGRLAAQFPATNKSWTMLLEPFQEVLVGNLKPALLVLFGAVGLVLLIACANVASLLVVRASGRRREIAVRKALGATRLQLVRQLLTESVLLAVAGGVLGVVVADAALGALRAAVPPSLSLLGPVHLDARVLLATLLVSVIAGLLFGLAPAAETGKSDLVANLKEGERGDTGRSRRALRRGLVVVEVSLSLVLLTGAGLLIHSLWRLLHVNPGFNPSNVVATQIILPDAGYPTSSSKVDFFNSLLTKLRGEPGIVAVGAISELPLSGQYNDNWFTIKGQPSIDTADKNDARDRVVTPGYFVAMRIPLFAGRVFSDQDGTRSAPVAIVDEQFVRRYLRGLDPLAQSIVLTLDGRETDFRIVGEVGNVRDYDLGSSATPEFYVPYAQLPRSQMNLVLRGSIAAGAIASEVRETVSAIDSREALSEFQPMPQLLAAATAQPRFSTLLLAIFAAVAILLAAVGLYGVLAYAVEGRTREIGIRVALGARRREILGLVFGEAAAVVGLGAAIGLAAAVGFDRLLSSQLFEVRPYDLLSFVVAVAVLGGAALVACWLPAWRAMQIDPAIALRHE